MMSGELSSRSLTWLETIMGVQIELDEAILPEIDKLASISHKSRSEMVNEILRGGLKRETTKEKIRRFQESYRLFPLTREEIEEQEAWEELQDWSEG